MNTRNFIFFTRILARAQISSLTSESFLLFAKCLGRVQLTRYKGRQKHKAKIGKVTQKLQFLGNFIFFAKCLGRVQLSISW